MAFTIEVEKRSKDEEFSFKDMEMFHKECLGGVIEQFISVPAGSDSTSDKCSLVVTCRRCRIRRRMELPEENRIAIMRIAIEGGEKKLGDDITVVQRSTEDVS